MSVMQSAWMQLSQVPVCSSSDNSQHHPQTKSSDGGVVVDASCIVGVGTASSTCNSTRSTTSSYLNDSSVQVFSDCSDLLHLGAEEVSNFSWNQTTLTANPCSTFVHQPSAFQPVLPASCTFRQPLFDRCSRHDNLPIWEEQEKYSCFTDSPATHSVFGTEPLVDDTHFSTVLEDVQSLIDVGFSCNKNCNAPSIKSELSLFENPNLEIKNSNKPIYKKRRKKKTAVKVRNDQYWERRKKNNLAAKNSRDAKREKELTTAQRAVFLEIEHTRLRLELSCLREQNRSLGQLFGILTTW